jgi:uncharacterized protein (DUF1499 family)
MNISSYAPLRMRAGSLFAWLALIAAVSSLAAVAAAGPGYRLGLWGLRPGIAAMQWAGGGAVGAATLGLLASLVLLGTPRPRTRRAALFAFVAGLALAAPLVWQAYRAQQVPRIHDISTEPDNPLPFIAALPLRQGARNSVAPDAATAAAQKKGYPDIAPLKLRLPPAQAFERAEKAAKEMGWAIVAADPAAMRIEATATTLLFGFKDDVVIRIAPDAGGGSRVDMRSLSRVGTSDLGVNAQRIRDYFARLSAG